MSGFYPPLVGPPVDHFYNKSINEFHKVDFRLQRFHVSLAEF